MTDVPSKYPWPFRKKTILIFVILLFVFEILGCITCYLDYQKVLSRFNHWESLNFHPSPIDMKSIYISLWAPPLCVVLSYVICILIWVAWPLLKKYSEFKRKFFGGISNDEE